MKIILFSENDLEKSGAYTPKYMVIIFVGASMLQNIYCLYYDKQISSMKCIYQRKHIIIQSPIHENTYVLLICITLEWIHQ